MSDLFRVHITQSVEYVFVIDAPSASVAEEIAECNLAGGFWPDERIVNAVETLPGSHLEVTSQRIPKEGA